jgi:hypothetical protein
MRHRAWILAVALSAIRAEGAITNLRVVGTTATQAIIAYTAPDGNACTMRVSESPSLTPLSHDVDPALFSGGDRDDRPGSITQGQSRIFVVGARVARKGSDTKYYSRALQNRTRHYFRVTCGSDTANGDFTTADWPPGITYNDLIPTDPSSPGATAWPQFGWTDRNESVIDPHTGMLVKRMTFPKMEKVVNPNGYSAVGLSHADGAGWTSPTNALADDSASATYSGTNQSPLALRTEEGVPDGVSVDGLQVYIKGCVDAGATGTDRDIEVSFGVDGGSIPYSKWLPLTLPNACTGSAQVVGDAADPAPVLSAWLQPNQQPPGAVAGVGMSTGYMSLAGTRGDYVAPYGFSLGWPKGTKIYVCSDNPCSGTYIPYTIQSVDSALKITTVEDMGTAPRRAWKTPTFTVLIRKRTQSTHQIQIQYVFFGLWYSGAAGFNGGAGSTTMCAPRKTPDATGKLGYHCATQSKYPGDWYIWWIAPSDGEVRYLGPLWTVASGEKQVCNQSGVSWDVSDPDHDALYCVVENSKYPSQRFLVQAKYIGNNHDLGPQGLYGDQETWNQWEWVNLTPPPNDLRARVQAFDPTYDMVAYQGIQVIGIQDNKVVLAARGGTQNAMGWNVVYDPSPGVNKVVAAMNSWSQAPARWCGQHTSFAWGDAKWMYTAGYHLTGEASELSGPFRTTITANLPGPPFSPCPDNVLGVSGNTCSVVTISGEPLTPAWANPPNYHLQDLAVGDLLAILPPGGVAEGEYVRIAAKNSLTLTLQRAYSGNGHARPQPAGSVIQPLCGALLPLLANYNSEQPTAWWWDFNNDPHGRNSGDPYGLGTPGATIMPEGVLFAMTHGTNRLNTTISDVSGVSIGSNPCIAPSPNSSAYGIRPASRWSSSIFTQGESYCVTGNAPFAGAYGEGSGNGVEKHPSYDQSDLSAPASARSWFFDGRPLNVYQDFPATASPVTGQLYKVTNLWYGQIPDWKRVVLFAQSAQQPLLEVSAPAPFTLSAGPEDSFKYCVALKDGECYAGSRANEVYANVPQHSSHPPQVGYGDKCVGKTAPYANGNDICFGVLGSDAEHMVQYGLTGKDEFYGRNNRRLTSGFPLVKTTSIYWNGRPLPDGSWAFFPNDTLNGVRSEVMLVKIPPMPAPDSVNRGDFVPIQVLVDPPQGTATAWVEFGYDPNFRCAGRAETCVSVSSAGDWAGKVPYYFAGETYTEVPCSSSCTIAIPALPQRMLYYRAKYRDASGAVTGVSASSVVAVP